VARPGLSPLSLPLARPPSPAQHRSDAVRNIFLTFNTLVGRSVYNSITAIEFLVGQTTGLYYVSRFQMAFLDDVHSLLKRENIGITTEELSPLFALLKGTQICYLPED